MATNYKPKISVITFFSLSPDCSGPGANALQIAEQLDKVGLLHKLVCLSYKEQNQLPFDKVFVPTVTRLYGIINKVCTIFKLPTSSVRAMKESVFDYFISRNREIAESDIVLFLKPCFPHTVCCLKQKGVFTIALASILHPLFNCDQIKKEEERHELDIYSSYTNKRRVNQLTFFFDNIDKLIVQSQLAKTIFTKQGVAKTRIELMHNSFGVDCNRFKPAPVRSRNDNFQLLHISHMNMIKGIAYLLAAWRESKLPDADLILGGNIDQDINILLKRNRTININLAGNIVDPVPYYQNADVFISPSISDLAPSTILEAMACSTPVISSNMCGASELISHGVNGFVYKYDSIQELKEIILWCSKNRDKLGTMGDSARQVALTCNRTNFTKNLVPTLCGYTKQSEKY